MIDKLLAFIMWMLVGVVVSTLGVLIIVSVSTFNISTPKNLNFTFPKLPKAYVVLSGSMEPVVKVGSIVISMPAKNYVQGDIISFTPEGENNVVTHRIKSIKFPFYTTAGDANKAVDGQEIKSTNIIGKVVITIPYVGYFANFAKSAKGFILLIVVPATIIIYEEFRFLGLEITKRLKKKKPTERKKFPKLFITLPLFGALLIIIGVSSSFFTAKQKSLQNTLGAAASFPIVYTMENKRVSGDWSAILGDGIEGSLKYIPEGPTFNYVFAGKGLIPTQEYCLIYYADGWPGDGPNHTTGFLIDKGNSDGLGNLNLTGDKDVGTSLPNSDDNNYPTGAKIWLVPCGQYDIPGHKIIGWGVNERDWLFEMGWVKYTRIVPTPTPVATPTNVPSPTPTGTNATISLSDLKASAQFGYVYDYSQAHVTLTYQTPAGGKLTGVISALGLKPYETYQLKLEGIPTCKDSSGDDVLNEKIGYKGRWWDNSSNSNSDDASYLANAIYKGGTHCIIGYLVWDFFTADSTGNVTKNVETANSYHVLWCGGGSCNAANNGKLQNLGGSTQPGFPYCAPGDVSGQLERGSCGNLSLDHGNYHLKLILNEESFHQYTFGTWTAVMDSPIDFQIN